MTGTTLHNCLPHNCHNCLPHNCIDIVFTVFPLILGVIIDLGRVLVKFVFCQNMPSCYDLNLKMNLNIY